MLAQKINAMFASIVDTGASHMKRTDAKEVLEAFHSRLLYAVRTEPKPKSMMFGDSIADEESALMKNFLNKFVEPKTIETEM